MHYSLKNTILHALEMNDLPAVVALARSDRKVLSQLVRLSYDKETLVGWRAILAVGMAARELVKTDPEFLRDACRKLLWSLNDESGGIGWSAPELLGEIVSSDAKRFGDLIPLIAEAYWIEGGMFKAGVVCALARISETAPEPVALHQHVIDDALAGPDSLARIRALELVDILLTRAGRSALWTEGYTASLKDRILTLCEDKGESWIYVEDDFVAKQVGESAIAIIKTF